MTNPYKFFVRKKCDQYGMKVCGENQAVFPYISSLGAITGKRKQFAMAGAVRCDNSVYQCTANI